MRYICNWGVGIHGKNYKRGDEIHLSAEEAAPLLASGSIGVPEKPSAFKRLFGSAGWVFLIAPADEKDGEA